MLELLISSNNSPYDIATTPNSEPTRSGALKGSHFLLGDHVDTPQSQPQSMNYFTALSFMTSQDSSTYDIARPVLLEQEHAQNAPIGDVDSAEESRNPDSESLGGVSEDTENSISDLQGSDAALADLQVQPHTDGAHHSVSSHAASHPTTHVDTSHTLNGHDPTNTIPVLRPDGSPLRGGDNKPVVRPDDGRDPQFFEARGESADKAGGLRTEKILEDLYKFRTNGSWDEQRIHGDRNISHAGKGLDEKDRNYATVAIGLYGCAAEIPIKSLLDIQDDVFHWKVFWHEIPFNPNDSGDTGFHYLPIRNYLNTQIGYSLCEKHTFPPHK